MTLDRRNLRRVAGAAALVVGALQTATAVVGVRAGRRDYADPVWGPGLAGVALTGAVVGAGDPVRRWTLAAVTTAWAARLGWLTGGRARSAEEEDPRYTEYLEDDGVPAVVAKVVGTQGLAQLLVTAPIQVAAASTLPRGPRRALFPLGVALMVGGAVTEALADRQKDAYKARDDEDRPPVLDTGLWGWSRHPNYFGDSMVWTGAWVASAASGPAWPTIPAPVAMTYFLVFATGARRTERRMQERPAYRDYQRRVAFFFPRPPREPGS
jgi:steroid 5-alpha reductase family enzyme